MKATFLVFSFLLVLFAACGAETVVGPDESGRIMEPAEGCGLDAKLC